MQNRDLRLGSTIERNQQLGRPIRDDDRRAFVGTVVDANVDHRIESAAEIYNRRANSYYRQGVAKEIVVHKEQELTQRQQVELAMKKQAAKQRIEAAVKQRGSRTYAEVAKGVKAKESGQTELTK